MVDNEWSIVGSIIGAMSFGAFGNQVKKYGSTNISRDRDWLLLNGVTTWKNTGALVLLSLEQLLRLSVGIMDQLLDECFGGSFILHW